MSSMRIWAAAVLLSACGGSDGGVAGAPDAAPGGEPDAGDPGPTLDERVTAAEGAAGTDPACTGLGDFYWEIGDASDAVASGSIGRSYSASSVLEIASGTKLVWGAYIAERFADDPTAIDVAAMTMRSGYTSFTSCAGTLTVRGCFLAGDNDVHTPADDDVYSYGGGHYQKYAVDLDLGAMGNIALAAELEEVLGDGVELAFHIPQPAAGLRMSPAQYARFLRKILSGQLAIAEQLGAHAVCTLPGECESARYSPLPLAWHYSLGHWVEDDPDGDGAFSSAGAFGFYPWIDASKSWYGIVARKTVGEGAGFESARCGAVIRRAFMTGAP